MNNFFINQKPYTKRSPGALMRFSNKVLRRVGLSVKPAIDMRSDMNSLEQRINFYHLLSHALVHKTEGDVVELGTFTGQCALLFQKVIEQHGSDKTLHVFDSFDKKFKEGGDIAELLLQNFETAGLKKPVVHKGYFEDTLATQLPAKVAFAHIDCGWGGDPQLHKKIILHCLSELYPRMSPGAVCLFMDYCDPLTIGETTSDTNPDVNPGVRLAVDEFFADKPEKAIALYGGAVAHAYIRKAGL